MFTDLSQHLGSFPAATTVSKLGCLPTVSTLLMCFDILFVNISALINYYYCIIYIYYLGMAFRLFPHIPQAGSLICQLSTPVSNEFITNEFIT